MMGFWSYYAFENWGNGEDKMLSEKLTEFYYMAFFLSLNHHVVLISSTRNREATRNMVKYLQEQKTRNKFIF